MPYQDKDKQREYWRGYWTKRRANEVAVRDRQRECSRKSYQKHIAERRERGRNYYRSNLEKMRAKGRAQRLKHRDKRLAQQRAKCALVKAETFAAYGGAVCYCCGERGLLFLAIDHIGTNGYLHRKEVKRQGNQFYAWLKKNKFPSGYRVACHNCNHGAYLNGGVCPHKGITGKVLVKTRRKLS